MDEKIPVGILGATGAVGQRFIQLLADHPWFRVTALSASERSLGKRYAEACHWVLDTDMPAAVRDMRLVTPEQMGTPVAFSALPSTVAGPIEEDLARKGVAVSSNTSTHRMDADVPLLIPEINADHAALVQAQRRRWPGMIVTMSNCASVPVVFALRALQDAGFGVRSLHVVTLQAVSGAGYPGVASLDILDNVVPYIGGEETKVEREPRKMLGRLVGDHVDDAPITISAQCNRVMVMDGHLACMSIALDRPASPADVAQALRGFRGQIADLELPSAPQPPIVVRDEPDRPQPRRDRGVGGGMTITVGRIQVCPLNTIKLVALAHNTIRGAAGGAILNAELLVKRGEIVGAHRNS